METVERERIDTAAALRRMGPLAADHPLVRDGTKCTACHEPFLAGQAVTLIAATCVHWACATGEERDG
jgi:hypothetical protein